MQKTIALLFILGLSLQGLSQNFITPSFPEYSTKIGIDFQHQFLTDTIEQRASSGAYSLYADIALNHILSLEVCVPFLINNPDAEDGFNFGNIQLGLSTRYWRHTNRGSVLTMQIGLPTASGDDWRYYDYTTGKYNIPNWWYINSNDLHKYLPDIYSTVLVDYAYHLHSRLFYFNFHINPILIARSRNSVFQVNSSLMGGVSVKHFCFSFELLNSSNLVGSDDDLITGGNWSILTGIQLMETMVRPCIYYRANFKNTNIEYARHILGIKLEIALVKKEKYLRNLKTLMP